MPHLIVALNPKRQAQLFVLPGLKLTVHAYHIEKTMGGCRIRAGSAGMMQVSDATDLMGFRLLCYSI